MSIDVVKSDERGLSEHGWLTSRHTFSFGDYEDDRRTGFGALRVINEDKIRGGTGFGSHPHRDMEIISYVVDGALEHRDSMGNAAVIRPGEVQRMSAGTGVVHSEQNHEKDKTTHFLQIWIFPAKDGLPPGYGQKSFADAFKGGGLVLVGSKDGRDGSVLIHQDVDMYALQSREAGSATLKTSSRRRFWVQAVKGDVQAGEVRLSAGDGAGITGAEALRLLWGKGAEFLVFDLP